MASHAPALAPRGTNGNGEFIPMTVHADVKCMLRRYLQLSATDPFQDLGTKFSENGCAVGCRDHRGDINDADTCQRQLGF